MHFAAGSSDRGKRKRKRTRIRDGFVSSREDGEILAFAPFSV
jgi:hypothetical protein